MYVDFISRKQFSHIKLHLWRIVRARNIIESGISKLSELTQKKNIENSFNLFTLVSCVMPHEFDYYERRKFECVNIGVNKSSILRDTKERKKNKVK